MEERKKVTEKFSESIQKHNDLDNAVIQLMPIWDTINDLARVNGIMNLLAYLTSSLCLKEDHEFEVFNETFNDISGRLNEITETFLTARKNVIFVKKEKEKMRKEL